MFNIKELRAGNNVDIASFSETMSKMLHVVHAYKMQCYFALLYASIQCEWKMLFWKLKSIPAPVRTIDSITDFSSILYFAFTLFAQEFLNVFCIQ